MICCFIHFIGTRIQAKCEFGICSLDIRGVYAEDSGTITCRAMNDSGTVETHCKLLCQGEFAPFC